MSKARCPAGCGKLFVSKEKAQEHATAAHPAIPSGEPVRKGWATPYGFGDFTEPVTYAEACRRMKAMLGEFKWPGGDVSK